MESFIPADVVESVRLRTDIVQVISEYTALAKKGQNYIASCPFHQERTPSFTVSREKQLFYCFGCGVGGNVFKFLMLAENLTFPEAVHRLAARAGIVIPEFKPLKEKITARGKERAWEINERVKNFYRHLLLNSPEALQAREYLAERALNADIQERFQIGYAPGGWNTLIDFLQNYCSIEEMVALGLAVVGERGKPYDRFRQRIIFPIRDYMGRVIGFGGRALGEGQPKYLNSSETVVFNKRHVLYGLDLARPSIRDQGYAIIMEGYMDVITAHQAGITNAVASLGTSLTEEQGKLLSRYTHELVIAYDTDAAGVAATLRGLDLLQEAGLQVKVVTVPEGKDPDEYIRHHGKGAWDILVENAELLLEYKLRQATQNSGNTRMILEQVLPNIAKMNSAVEKEEGIKMIAARLNLSWETVRSELRRFQAVRGKKWSKPDKIVKNMHNIIEQIDSITRTEREIIRLLLENPENLSIVQAELGEWFPRDPALRQIYLLLCQGNDLQDPAGWMQQLDEETQQVLSRLLIESASRNSSLQILPDLVAFIKSNLRQQNKAKLLSELAEAEKIRDYERITQLLYQLQEILDVKQVANTLGRGGKK